MYQHLFVFALALLQAQASPRPSPEPVSGTRIRVTLETLSSGMTPVGLPTTLEITVPALPARGNTVTGIWRALDGDVPEMPRGGAASIRLDQDGEKMTITLGAGARPSGGALTLTGTLTGNSVHGSFSDRLFFRRAGRFEGGVVAADRGRTPPV
jgi:hypothetical protein